MVNEMTKAIVFNCKRKNKAEAPLPLKIPKLYFLYREAL
jgi:hypothetical protein